MKNRLSVIILRYFTTDVMPILLNQDIQKANSLKLKIVFDLLTAIFMLDLDFNRSPDSIIDYANACLPEYSKEIKQVVAKTYKATVFNEIGIADIWIGVG